MISRALTSLISPAGSKARLTVLLYHRVLPVADPRVPAMPHVSRFRQEMRWFADQFRVRPLSQAVTELREGKLPARAGAISFDDGFLDNFEIAAPILRELKLPACFFVSTAYLDGAIPFFETAMEIVHQQRSASIDLRRWQIGEFPCATLQQRQQTAARLAQWLKYRPGGEATALVHDIARHFSVCPPDGLMMNREQLCALRDLGMEIGGHSHDHVILSTLSDEAAQIQLARNHQVLCETLGQAPRLFAYPNGKPGVDFTAFHAQAVRSLGYDAAFSSIPGAAHQASDLYAIPRFGPWGTSALRFKIHLLRNLTHD